MTQQPSGNVPSSANDPSFMRARIGTALAAVLLVITVELVAGCSPSVPAPNKAQKPPIEFAETYDPAGVSLPSKGKARRTVGVKPGHLNAIVLPTRANDQDLRGELTWQNYSANGVPLPLPHSNYAIQWQRPITLPQGQLRPIEWSLFWNMEGAFVSPQLQIAAAGAGNRVSATHPAQVRVMPEDQFQFLVMSRYPSSYHYLTFAEATQFRRPLQTFHDGHPHYDVLFAPTNGPVAWPRGLLHWTKLAYIVWDDFDIARLGDDDFAALIDWLHWGGQLIVSGPDSMAELAKTRLGDFLPAFTPETIELNEKELAPLNVAPWTRGFSGIKPLEPWSGVKLVPVADAVALVEVDDTPLVVERRVGRGRIVATAFRLNQREFVDWRGHDGFFSACLMRRPPRQFEFDRHGDLIGTHWREGDANDPRLGSTVRLFNRDAGSESEDQSQENEVADSQRIGAWSDDNQVAVAARHALVEAAGIAVPSRGMVARLLAIYIVLVAPVNWALFRLLRRVEWAWIMTPLLAIAFTGIVTWMAQINVGFASAQTEITVIEQHANHSQAHVGRYVALYGSLGAAYKVHSEGPDALALPMTAPLQSVPRPGGSLGVRVDTAQVDGRTMAQAHLSGFEISSNSTGVLHIEQSRELPALEFRRLDARRCQLIHRGDNPITGGVVGDEGSIWLGAIAGGSTIEFQLHPPGDGRHWRPSSDREGDRAPVADSIDLGELVEVADRDRLAGELRFIGWSNAPIAGTTIEPSSTQTHTAALWVVHLDFGPLGELRADINIRPRVKSEDAVLQIEPAADPKTGQGQP